VDIDHTSMEAGGKGIRDQGRDLDGTIKGLRNQLEPLIPYFGNPESDEAARTFRKGADGHPGFDSAYQDLMKALDNMVKAYPAIGDGVVAMSKNVKMADWASMVNNPAVRELIEFGKRKNDEIAVPDTPVETT
jgi:hypothetical protein